MGTSRQGGEDSTSSQGASLRGRRSCSEGCVVRSGSCCLRSSWTSSPLLRVSLSCGACCPPSRSLSSPCPPPPEPSAAQLLSGGDGVLRSPASDPEAGLSSD